MKSIQIGDRIPEFTLKDQDDNLFDIKDYLGKKKLVIYFYPKDGSLTCTRQACYFRDLSDVIEETGAMVIGISQQSVESHKSFAEANNLNFTLLSDSDNVVRKLFGVPTDLFGLIPGRVTYVVNLQATVVHIFNSQKNVQRHVDEALKMLLVLKKTDNGKED
ncbi:MAG: peroxiredoxin [Bacteroidales bacterium]|nr:peroxiredoxin [Bacteroidales bacterium]